MKRFWFTSRLTLVALPTACRPEPLLSNDATGDCASRPALQDAQSPFILAQVGHDPRLTVALQDAYGEVPALQTPTTQALPTPTNRLGYVKSLAWGTPLNFEAALLGRHFTDTLHPGLDFGCHQTFHPVCLVHDSGHHNLRVLERTSENRTRTDGAFFANLKAVCNTRFLPQRPSCYAPAFRYAQGVRLGGGALF